MESTCSKCHSVVKSSDYFCFNCGNSLKPRPLETSLVHQILIYVGSILLPPIGIIWGVRYLRQKEQKCKIIGIICIFLTIISLIFVAILAINTINTVNSEVSRQLQLLNGY